MCAVCLSDERGITPLAAGTGTGGKWDKEGRKADGEEKKNMKETVKYRRNKRACL